MTPARLEERRRDAEQRLAELLVEQGFATAAQIEAARRLQSSAGPCRIEDALLQSGALTQEQVAALRRRLGWRLAACPACGFQHTVDGVPPGRHACPACGSLLALGEAGAFELLQASDAGPPRTGITTRSRALPGGAPEVESFLVLSTAIERGIIAVPEARELVAQAGLGPRAVQELARRKSLDPDEVAALCQLAQSDRLLLPEAARRACDGLGAVLDQPELYRQLETMTQSLADRASVLPGSPEEREKLVTERLIARGLLRHADRQVCLKLQEEDRARSRSMPLYHYALRAGRVNGRQLQQVLDEIRDEYGIRELEPTPARRPTTVVQRQGSRLAGFTVKDRLGGGGMGMVYLVEDDEGRAFALKTLKAGEEASDRQVQRFQREAEALSRLDHPGIVRIHQSGIWEGIPYFTMDYVDGPTLAHLIGAMLLQRATALELLARVLDALEHAHQQGILHRDLKPSNILIDAEGRPRLTDFGLAKRLDVSQRLTRTGDAIGTPYYMAPEQASGRLDLIGRQSDTYACGVLLYQTLSGQLPFTAQTTMELYYRIAEGNPLPPSAIDGSIPADLDRICLKALATGIEDRYATAAEFADDLRRFLAGKRPRARPPGPLRRSLRWLDRVRLRSWVASAVLCCLFAGVGYLLLLTRQAGESIRAGQRAASRRRALLLVEEGRALFELADLERATFRFRQAAQLSPESVEPEIELALVDLRRGATADAEWRIRRCLAADDRLPRAQYALGRLSQQRGDPFAALACFSRAIELFPRFVEAYRERAAVQQGLGQSARAAVDRAQADEIARRRAAGWLARAEALLAEDDEPRAAALARRCLHLWPLCAGAEHLLGRIATRQGELHKAQAHLARAISHAPADPRLHTDHGRVLRAMGESRRALLSFRTATGLEPGGAGPYEALDLALELVDLTRARAALREMRPAHAPARYHTLKGRLLALEQRHAEALVESRQAQRHERDYLPALLLEARLQAELGGDAQPIERRLEARLVAGGAAAELLEIRQALGRLRLRARNWARAHEVLAPVLEAGRRTPHVLAWCAEALHHLGRQEAARALLDEAIERQPAEAPFLVLRGRVWLALERWREAEQDFERVGRLDPGSPERIRGLYETYLGQLDAERLIGFLPLVERALAARPRPGSFLEPSPALPAARATRAPAPLDLASDEGAARFARELKGLLSKSPELFAAAVRGLSAFGDPGVERLRRLRDGSSGALRPAYSRALDKLLGFARRRREAEQVDLLVRALVGRDPVALLALRRPDRGRAAVLSGILRSSTYSSRVRRLAAQGLIELRTRGAVAALVAAAEGDDPIARLFGAAALDSAGLLPRPAPYARIAPRLRGEELAYAVDRIDRAALRPQLDAPDERVALAAAIRLAASDPAAALPVLLRLARSAEPSLLLGAAGALGRFPGDARVRDRLLGLLAHPHLTVARQALHSLRGFKDPAVTARLLELVRGGPDRLQIDALLALGARRAAGLRQAALARLFDAAEDPLVRAVSLRLLVALGDPQVLLAVSRLLDDPDRMVRTVVLLAIGGFGRAMPQVVVPLLARQLAARDPLIRTTAALALSQYPVEPAEQALRPLLRDPIEMVRGAAAGSLTFLQMVRHERSPELERIEAGDDPALRRGAAIALARLVVLRRGKLATSPAGRARLLGWLDRAIALYPAEARYLRLRASLREADGRSAAALADRQQVLRLAGAVPADHARAGVLAERLGQHGPALQSLARYAAAGGRSAGALVALGRLQERAGRTEEALATYDRAALLAPRSGSAHAGHARCQIHLQRLAAAAQTLLEARRLAGARWELVVEEARLALRQQHAEDAVRKLQQAARLGLPRAELQRLLEQADFRGLRDDAAVKKLLAGPGVR